MEGSTPVVEDEMVVRDCTITLITASERVERGAEGRREAARREREKNRRNGE